MRDEADIAVSSFFATKDRGEVVDFSVIMEYAEFWLPSPHKDKLNISNILRNKFFIKYPGRNLGGYMAFLRGTLSAEQIIHISHYHITHLISL